MNERRIKEYKELLNGEEEIKKELNKPGGLDKGYKIYYLLDNNWVEKYKNLISNNNINIKEINKLLKVSLIKKKSESKDFTYVYKGFIFNFPCDFTLFKQNFIDLLCKNFNEEEQLKIKSTSFKIIIGGKCFIMKDKYNEKSPYAYIALFNEKKKKFNNNIDYFLRIDDREELDKNLNYILKNNIWNYFKEINYSYKDEYKRIKNYEGKKIGYLVLNNGYIKQIEEIYNYMKENINIKMNSDEIKDINTNRFYSLLLCLYNIKEIYNQLKIYNKDKKIIKILFDFILSKKIDDNIKKYFLESIKSNDYKIIINDLFEKINSELSNENKNEIVKSQVVEYDETRSKNKFLEKNKNPSIINKLFFISKEDIIICQQCNVTNYNFYYSKFFLIDLDKEEKEVSLNEHIFKSENMQIKRECIFCEKTTNSIKKEIIFDYPEILIVLLDGKKFKNFKLENNNYILCNNGQDIIYYLISFIESDSNIVYIDDNNK